MLSKDQARALVAKRLRAGIVILDERTIEKDWGWVFFYQSKRFVETKNPLHRLVGNSPRIVNRFDGSIHHTGTKYSLERYIHRYERQLTGDAPDFGETPSAWLNYVTFDATHYVYEAEPPAGPDDFTRKWHTADGAVDVDLRLIILPPRLPAASIAQIEEFYKRRLLYRFLEMRLVTLDAIDCVWAVLTTPPEAPTRCYHGELVIPFADFSFEFIIASEDPAAARPKALSRIRREFARISRSLRVDNTAKDQKRFALPHD